MDEKEFEKMMKDMLTGYFYELKVWFQNNGYMKPVGDKPNSIPKQGGYTIAKDGCNKCGGKITWDLYDKEGGHPYPDHVDEDGKLMDCPNYTQ